MKPEFLQIGEIDVTGELASSAEEGPQRPSGMNLAATSTKLEPPKEVRRPLFAQRVPENQQRPSKEPTPGQDRIDVIPPRRPVNGGTRQTIPFIPGRRPRPPFIPPRKPSRYGATSQRPSVTKKPFKPTSIRKPAPTSAPPTKRPFPFDLSSIFGKGESPEREPIINLPRLIQSSGSFIEPQDIDNILLTDTKVSHFHLMLHYQFF